MCTSEGVAMKQLLDKEAATILSSSCKDHEATLLL